MPGMLKLVEQEEHAIYTCAAERRTWVELTLRGTHYLFEWSIFIGNCFSAPPGLEARFVLKSHLATVDKNKTPSISPPHSGQIMGSTSQTFRIISAQPLDP
jgi:hypothetical protein